MTQEYCDDKFCNCLQEAFDKMKFSTTSQELSANKMCFAVMEAGCLLVKSVKFIFSGSTPADHSKDFIDFIDYKPLGLDMKNLLDSCPANQRIIVHCHNTVVHCLLSDHATKKRNIIYLTESYQDCRAVMYDCLRYVIDTSPNDQCTSIVLREREKINIYQKISSEDDGESINLAYPIIASRMVEKCPLVSEHVHTCYKSFHSCAVETTEMLHERYIEELREACGNNCNPTDVKKHPEYYLYDDVRKIDTICHRSLSKCINDIIRHHGTKVVTSDPCVQAIKLATNRIREKNLIKW
ncbi:hypothetical protein PRIPAC_73594 [Pristionchus pacificus]|uniref:Uncharacterized protein n=1 Tax=Pristionchus pacificus TaxID=54126 RepID=A0A2A6CSZ0_PRIPA|nr:hypothetical protein PRIPAC_73594 [Pristionchus pacificus]|eukprot:PDM81153.1 hypothetical protein PRIPAC_36156 [Pristionchus pacificus]